MCLLYQRLLQQGSKSEVLRLSYVHAQYVRPQLGVTEYLDRTFLGENVGGDVARRGVAKANLTHYSRKDTHS
jgi:hypothetical protein